MIGRVVVGVHRSACSLDAVDLAAREAALRGLPLRVIHAWIWPHVHRGADEIRIVGPIRHDPRAVDRPGSAKEGFHVDRQAETVTCPQGTVSPRLMPGGR